MAIKRAIASQRASADSAESGVADPGFSGITEQDLQMSFQAEYAENDIFPPTDITEDWLKLIDYDPEYVVKIAPVRPNTAQRGANLGGVI
jgi:proteasome-associated ATPase